MLSEWSLNETIESKNGSQCMTKDIAFDEGTRVMRFTVELLDKLERDQHLVKKYIENNLNQTGCIEIFGWSKQKYIPNSFYDGLFTSDLKLKKLILRGRGVWDTCHCPKNSSTNGAQIDTITEENITHLEHIYIMRTFNVSACALLDLISRSPNLKTVRFYGVLTKNDHHEAFKSVRFLSELERVYWPWCSKKLHSPTLKTLVKRHDKIVTFYSNAETTCDLLAADALQNLRNLSLILNENWACKPGNTQKASRYLKKIVYLSHAKNLEALEIRSFDLNLDEEGHEETNLNVRRLYETYQLSFWEQVVKLKNLKYLAVYGAWELDKVSRELARHGIQIEYFKTNLMPSSLMPCVDKRDDILVLSMAESIKQLGKLVKLRSLHFICHENLTGIDEKTVAAMKEISDLIWTLDIRIKFTPEVEDLLTNMLRRGNQLSRGYKIKLHVECSETRYANLYLETFLKFSSSTNLRTRLESVVEAAAKERFGKSLLKAYHIWGVQQVSSREKTIFEQLKSTWEFYDEIFEPVDMFV